MFHKYLVLMNYMSFYDISQIWSNEIPILTFNDHSFILSIDQEGLYENERKNILYISWHHPYFLLLSKRDMFLIMKPYMSSLNILLIMPPIS